MSDDILFEVTEKVGVITLNRPEKKNAMNSEIVSGLMEMLNRIKTDPEIRAGIIIGAGNTFSAGADLKERAAGGGAPASIVACVLRGGLYGGLAANAARVVRHSQKSVLVVR